MSEDPVEAIVRAVLEPGRAPQYHRQQMTRLRTEWPVLATAVRNLIVQRRGPAAVPRELL